MDGYSHIYIFFVHVNFVRVHYELLFPPFAFREGHKGPKPSIESTNHSNRRTGPSKIDEQVPELKEYVADRKFGKIGPKAYS